ncbi:MAG: phenylalanine--tRNA ligase subunit beta [Candidatus Bathyarchaeia archaeon]
MPVIDVNLEDFRELLGREVELEELREKMPMMGTSWEGESREGFTIEVFPNRPDLLSIEGLARAYASFTGEMVGLRKYRVSDSGYRVVVEERVKEVRPYFVSAVVKGFEFTDSLIRSVIQMQEKLHITHGRRRRKVAIGLHDLDAIDFPVAYTTRHPEFQFRPLGERFEKTLREILVELPKGQEYSWVVEGFDEYPILVDEKGMVLSMPPIINSEHTRIDEATTEVFIDITGTDLKAIDEALNIICTTLADRGAEIYGVQNEYYDGGVLDTPDLTPGEMRLEVDYVNEMLGLDLDSVRVAELLECMGHGFDEHEVESYGGVAYLPVRTPAYRTDIMHPIDLVEDVAIAYGYNRFEPRIPPISSEAGEDPREIFSRKLRNFMVGFGILEVVTFMMSNKDKLFKKMSLEDEPVAETSNPKMEAYTVLRNRLLPSLMEVLSYNKHHPYPQNLYEIDDVILLDSSTETGARSARRLAVTICHAKANFSEIKALMDSLLQNLDVYTEVQASGWECFIEGRRFTAKASEKPLCWGGEVKPEVLVEWDLQMPVAALEMDVDLLYSLIKRVRRG